LESSIKRRRLFAKTTTLTKLAGSFAIVVSSCSSGLPSGRSALTTQLNSGELRG
jgi:hypothetical protein